MNLRPPRTSEEPEVNLTSLIDVVLMLLIFFMVATTFDREASLKVDLPKASPAAENSSDNDQPIELIINAEGRYFLSGQEVVSSDAATLKRAIEKITGGRKDVHLSLRAAATTQHQAVVTAMDVAGQLGISRLSIATLQEGEGN